MLNTLLKKKSKRGFTLIEMAVSVAIFTIITTVVLYRHSSFSNNILITNLAYDIALSLRQAQVYGLSSVGVEGSGGNIDFRVGYGVHFNVISEEAQKSFIFFADAAVPEDRIYDVSSVCGDLNNRGECVEQIPINGGNRIEKLCVKEGSSDLNCSIDSLDVVFKRPETEATLKVNGDDSISGITLAQIYVISPQKRQKIVTVQASGQISISDPVPATE